MRQLSKSHLELLLIADQELQTDGLRRTDLVLARRYGLGGRVMIEVNGFQDRSGRPRTNYGVDYAARQPARLRAYADAGLEPPVTVYADEVFDNGEWCFTLDYIAPLGEMGQGAAKSAIRIEKIVRDHVVFG